MKHKNIKSWRDKKITRRTIGAKGFNLLQERVDKKDERSKGNHFLLLSYYYLFPI